MPLQIKEPLPIPGGSLVATASGWAVEFMFPGPDQRYSHTFVTLAPRDLERLLGSYPLAFERYLRVKAELPAGTKASEAFDDLLTIRVGDFADGVCLAVYRAPIASQAELEQRLGILRAASARGDALVTAARGFAR